MSKTPHHSSDGSDRTTGGGLRLLVNAGPTREYFDTVRFISNPSTGKQGYAIAEVAAERGHFVTLVSGPVQLAPPAGVQHIRVTTAQEMAQACKRVFEQCDAAILTAAVCDYRPQETYTRKLKKTAAPRQVVLEPTEDICASLGRVKGGRLLIGFAMDDHDGEAAAEAKLARKNCDLIVQNGPNNIGAERVEVQFLEAGAGWRPRIGGTKHDIAACLLEWIEQRLSASGSTAHAEQQ